MISLLRAFVLFSLTVVFTSSWADKGFPTKTVDGELELLLPDGWEATAPHSADTLLMASNKIKHEYVMVLATATVDYAGTFKTYAANRIHFIKGSMVDVKDKDAKELTINNQPALQYEVHGTMLKEGFKIGYLITFMQMKNHIVQIASWTTESRFTHDLPELESIPALLTEVNEGK